MNFFVETTHVSVQLLSFRKNNDTIVIISKRRKVLGRWKQLQSYSAGNVIEGPE